MDTIVCTQPRRRSRSFPRRLSPEMWTDRDAATDLLRSDINERI